MIEPNWAGGYPPGCTGPPDEPDDDEDEYGECPEDFDAVEGT